MINFQKTRVLITGAGGGVGRSLTAAFASAGALVVACDLPDVDLSESHIKERHYFDLRQRNDIEEHAQAILSGGVPQIVVSNAGWTREENLATTTGSGILDEMDINFTGPALLAHALLPAMRTFSGDKAFVFVASCNALSHFGNPAYSAAKAATLAWMRAIAVEEAPNGIRANAVAPASIRTEAWDHRLKKGPKVLDRLKAIYPMGRLVSTQEVANAVLFLASSTASGITGITMNVDAGLTAGNLPFLEAIK